MPFWLQKPFDLSDTIGVLGCGWLGLPLAKSLIAQGNTVHGSTTSKEKFNVLIQEGINPYLIILSEKGIEGDINNFLKGINTLVINVPPKLRGSHHENFVAKMKLLHLAITASSVKKVIFVSSTSVYGNIAGIVTDKTETRPDTESGKQLVAAEQLFLADKKLQTNILRFGGLIGPDRHPVRHLAGKKGLTNGEDPINLIHLDDCIGILKTIINHNYWGDLFNAVYPYHPPKKTYYAREALKIGLEPPKYIENDSFLGKRIVSYNLIFVKKYTFKTSIAG